MCDHFIANGIADDVAFYEKNKLHQYGFLIHDQKVRRK